MRRPARFAVVLGALALMAGACGSSDDSSDSSDAGAEGTVAVEVDGTAVGSLPDSVSESATAPSTDHSGDGTVDGAGRRIIPLDGDVAEIVFALGFGDEVVAADLSATYPPEVDDLPKFGFARALNAEPILAFEPTIVIGTDTAGPADTIEQIERVGVPVTIIEREFSPNGPADKIRSVAAALGVPDAGESLATDVQAQIDDATVDESAYDAPMRVVAIYLRGAQIQFVLGAGSGIDWIIDAAGAIDIADELGVVETSAITAEAILASAPDAIIVPEGGLASAGGMDELLAVPGIAETPAGRSGAIFAYDDQLMLGNGPRTGEFLARLVEDLRALDRTRSETQDS